MKMPQAKVIAYHGDRNTEVCFMNPPSSIALHLDCIVTELLFVYLQMKLSSVLLHTYQWQIAMHDSVT